MVIWEKIKEQALSGMDRLCSSNAYHNREHVETVLNNLDRVEDHLVNELSEEENLLFRIAILYHDYDHPGYEIRSACPLEIPRKDLSNEEYSALICEQELEGQLTKDQIEVIKNIILSTSVDQKYPASTKLEKLMAFVDIANFMNSESALKEDSIKLSKEHCSKNPLDKISQEKFLSHINKTIEAIREYLRDDFYQELKRLELSW